MTKLNADATIISVYDTLTHAVRLSKAALDQARRCVREHGNAAIRIGITGTGQKPCYRVTYLGADDAEQIFGSWWDMGDPLSKEDAVNGNWSTASVTYDALETFLRQRLGYAGPAPKK